MSWDGWTGGEVVLVLLSLLLSLAPQYVPASGPGGTPAFVGTYWRVGAPLVVAGIAALWWGRGERPRNGPGERP